MPNVFKEKARVLGISESFSLSRDKSFLAGVVMRKDLVLDDVFIEEPKIGGNDVSEKIVNGFRSLRRTDVSCLMIEGCVLSMYNIVDLEYVYNSVKLPIICITDRKGKDLRESFAKKGQEDKLKLYEKLGPQKELNVLGYKYWVRFVGLDEFEVKHVIKSFIVSGRKPEPIRVAKIIARAFLKRSLSRNI